MELSKINLFVITLALIIGQASAADVIVTPSTKTVIQGQSFNLNVTINPQGAAIAGAQLDIGFNMSLIRVNSIIEGNLFTQNGANTFFNGGTINNTTGTVINIFDAIIGMKNVSTQGNFIIINATATGSSGTSYLNLSNVKISDPNGNGIILNVKNGSVTINSPPAVNIPPVLAAIGNKTVNTGQVLSFTISATDAYGDVLRYSASNLPPGASFNSTTRTFRWKPGSNQIGIYSNVHFEVSDGTFIDFENITINVKKKRR